MSETYRLPDRTETTSMKKWITAWEDLATPICKATGLVLLAYDPDVWIGTTDWKKTVSLPVWFCELLGKRLKDDR